jgi:hypothetical protein
VQELSVPSSGRSLIIPPFPPGQHLINLESEAVSLETVDDFSVLTHPFCLALPRELDCPQMAGSVLLSPALWKVIGGGLTLRENSFSDEIWGVSTPPWSLQTALSGS